MGACPATILTLGEGGSYFLKGSRPPPTDRFVTTGFCGSVSWPITPIAKPLATSNAALDRKLVNRILAVCLTCIIIFAFFSYFAGCAAGAGTDPPDAGLSFGAGTGACKRSDET